jgi:hypothetical protein
VHLLRRYTQESRQAFLLQFQFQPAMSYSFADMLVNWMHINPFLSRRNVMRVQMSGGGENR